MGWLLQLVKHRVISACPSTFTTVQGRYRLLDQVPGNALVWAPGVFDFSITPDNLTILWKSWSASSIDREFQTTQSLQLLSRKQIQAMWVPFSSPFHIVWTIFYTPWRRDTRWRSCVGSTLEASWRGTSSGGGGGSDVIRSPAQKPSLGFAGHVSLELLVVGLLQNSTKLRIVPQLDILQGLFHASVKQCSAEVWSVLKVVMEILRVSSNIDVTTKTWYFCCPEGKSSLLVWHQTDKFFNTVELWKPEWSWQCHNSVKWEQFKRG